MRVLLGTWLASLVTVVGGCGDNSPATPPEPIAIGESGSISTMAGVGSFTLGVASAATQIEEANTATDWFVWTQPVSDGGLGKGEFVGDAVGGYSRALEDSQLVADLGLDAYRFSIEWARVEPQRGVIDETALAHYGEQLDALVAAGIRPSVTIHHFSNPVWVADPRDTACAAGPNDTNLCGLGHPTGGALIVDEMAAHARLLAERFGDRVDEWATVNEPINYLLAAYGTGTFPPGKLGVFQLREKLVPVVRDYLAAHAAMATALHTYDTVDADGDGVAAAVGMTLSVADWVASRNGAPSANPEDTAARDRVVQLFHYWFVDGATTGGFDSDLDGVADEQHPEWANSIDWLGLQYYFRAGVTGSVALLAELGLTPCFGGFGIGTACLPARDATFCVPSMGYETAPDGLTGILQAFSARYPQLPLLVSESGIATTVGARRAENIVRTLEAISAARASGVDVRGFYYWSLTDNFEWAEGYAPKFGLFSVDRDSFARTATLGADVLAEIASTRSLSSELRATFGGTGPMTIDPQHNGARACANLE